eukprot:5394175-Pyramimonas_sp.AAC.1
MVLNASSGRGVDRSAHQKPCLGQTTCFCTTRRVARLEKTRLKIGEIENSPHGAATFRLGAPAGAGAPSSGGPGGGGSGAAGSGTAGSGAGGTSRGSGGGGGGANFGFFLGASL